MAAPRSVSRRLGTAASVGFALMAYEQERGQSSAHGATFSRNSGRIKKPKAHKQRLTFWQRVRFGLINNG